MKIRRLSAVQDFAKRFAAKDKLHALIAQRGHGGDGARIVVQFRIVEKSHGGDKC